MIKVFSICRIVQSGEWQQCIEILNEGSSIGFVDRERTRFGRVTRTRNLQGEVREGECLEWLLRQAA